MSKAKAAPIETVATSSGASAAAKAATRRKSHPKFELPEDHGHAATDWAFRDEVNTPKIAVMPGPADTQAASAKPETPVENEAQLSAPWAAPVFLGGAVIGGTAITMGLAVVTALTVMKLMTSPARIARSLF